MRSLQLLPPLLCLLLLCQPHAQVVSASPPPSSQTPHPTPPQSPAVNVPHQSEVPGTWQSIPHNGLNQVIHGANRPSPARGNNSLVSLDNLMPQLPGLIKGLRGEDLGQDDAGRVLARLFADPRAAGIPAWIEILTQGGSSPQDHDTRQQQRVKRQTPEVPFQDLLAQIFANVTQGLQSLNLTGASSLEDIIAAVLNDTGLLGSLSTEALETILSALNGTSGLGDVLQEAFPVDPQSSCAADLQTWATALTQQQLWALQVLDATGKLQAGVFTGQLILVGDYDQCVDPHFIDTSTAVRAKLCPMAFTPPTALAPFLQSQLMAMHLCVPKSCSEMDLYGLLTPTLEALGSEHRGIRCVGPRDPSDDPRFIGVTAMLAVLASLCAVGTAYGIYWDRQKEKQKQANTKPMETKGYINNAYVTNGDALNTTNGGHMNGKVTNENAPNMINGSHVNGSLSNEDASTIVHGSHVNGNTSNGIAPTAPNAHLVNTALPGNYVKHCEDEEKLDLKDMEGGLGFKHQNVGGPVVSVNGTIGDTKPSGGSSRPSAEESLGSKLLLSFSVLKNGSKVLSCQRNQTDISCLHGIRVLSITWVVLGHSYAMLDPATGNSVSKNKAMERVSFMVIPAGVLAVDTFFLLSGCLSSFLFLRSSQKSGLSVSGIVLYYIHRYWRLTPLYAVFLGVYVGIYPYLKEGPYQNLLGMDSESTCRDYWHYNLLYINNVVSGSLSKMCFGWSWYLSNDMQFSFLAPLVLIPWALKGKWKVIGFVLCGGMVLTHCIATGVISSNEDATMFSANGAVYMEQIYFTPWTRIGPYAIGLLLGYILFVTPSKYTMDKMTVFLGWTLASGVALTVVYVLHDNLGDLLRQGAGWNTSQAAAYEALDKVLWALCVAWLIFACCKGYGGFVNTLLSWSAWQPLSRLTYGVYLVHIVVMFVIGGNFKKPIYMDNFSATVMFLSSTVLSFLLSFIFSMMVEAPTLGLEKAVLGKIFRAKK